MAACPFCTVHFSIVDLILSTMPSEIETSDSDSSVSDELINLDPEVAAAYIRGPDRVLCKGKQYLWHNHRDNIRAFRKPSVIWLLDGEYERGGDGFRKKFWRCGICKKTTMLACDVGIGFWPSPSKEEGTKLTNKGNGLRRDRPVLSQPLPQPQIPLPHS